MSRRGPKNFRLPAPPEGDAREEALRRVAGKMATVRDVERLLQAYDQQFVEPLRQRVLWHSMPWYQRALARVGWLEPARKWKHRAWRWWTLKRSGSDG